jgi:RNA polymerase sigma-70 factor, ECF subfamily
MNDATTGLESIQPPPPVDTSVSGGVRRDGMRVDALDIVASAQPARLSVDNEGALIAAAQKDPTAFGPLYERYVDQIYRYVYRRVGNHVEAEDLTAQTFQQALGALPSYQWRGLPFGAWLYRIAGNLIIRHRRVRGREIAVEHVERIVDERGAFDDPADALLRRCSSEQLVEAMQRLNDDQRRALVLKYSHGLKNHEVGTVMGRTEGGVKQLVHRAMLVLREALTHENLDGLGERALPVPATRRA